MHKGLLYAIIGCVLGAAALTVIQIWTTALDWEVFIKLIGTLGIAVLVIGFLLVVKADFGEHKKMKDENYLD